ncbi:uncharacterized protein PGTG_03473 [Puccinia graminis f. sp. tritici CRL 75-36-700-3]|uniref:mannan endo-1,6-alpha-mannosidase n=1 Tax=Puccinia graminis f. sp. tritici (strain CRL 75-36-700-3 / race SCCL) TaxID=418459 RepID=E3JZP2_PUCGT|nr:uncharacterized protein PGTG_03473 [Puccinia graminis f. sp. tritici CRL 75-36-700-3]EFP77517.2 hypothetical protein PGTG_03473 [Puccinia graminis f. sp. tritici CRL 75-36-700-3]
MRCPSLLIGIGLLVNFVPLAIAAPALDLNNIDQLKKAASAAMNNLMSYYSPNFRGAFDTDVTPWHESLMIWSLNFDYASYVGDAHHLGTVQNALYRQSNNQSHSFIVNVPQQWNDDALWGAQVPVAAAEYFGPQTKLPKSSETWIHLAQKTLRQVEPQTNQSCGGGLFWYRTRSDPDRGSYKALITNSEFISVAARGYLITKDKNALEYAKTIIEWVIGTSSGLADVKTGRLQDGLKATKESCTITPDEWSYNYGQWLGSLAWMHRATGDQKYLDMASPFFYRSLKVFAPSGVIAELCEPDSCKRDPKGFKAIYVRNLVYLHQETNDQALKKDIQNVIDTSVKAMVKTSCDADFNCAAAWAAGRPPEKNVRSQHVSAALLVSAVGIHRPPAKAGRGN